MSDEMICIEDLVTNYTHHHSSGDGAKCPHCLGTEVLILHSCEYLTLILQTAGEAVVGTARQQPVPVRPINRPARSKADIYRQLAFHYAALGKLHGRLATIMAEKTRKVEGKEEKEAEEDEEEDEGEDEDGEEKN